MEFSDVAGLLNGLSTGVQHELDRLATKARASVARRTLEPADRAERTRRYKQVCDHLDFFFQPISNGLRKDTAIWRGIMRDKDRRDSLEYRMAYELEVKQVLPNHKEMVSVIDKWRHLVNDDSELCDILDEYLRHVAAFVAVRDRESLGRSPSFSAIRGRSDLFRLSKPESHYSETRSVSLRRFWAARDRFALSRYQSGERERNEPERQRQEEACLVAEAERRWREEQARVERLERLAALMEEES